VTHAAATLNDAEIDALRRVGIAIANSLPRAHRERLVSLGLITLNGSGVFVLTRGGKERLAEEKASGRLDNPRGREPSR
jgi:hypothetical protein